MEQYLLVSVLTLALGLYLHKFAPGPRIRNNMLVEIIVAIGVVLFVALMVMALAYFYDLLL